VRVGVFVGDIWPEEGGGNTLRTGIIDAIKTAPSRHKFVLFHPTATGSDAFKNTTGSFLHQTRRWVRSHPVVGSVGRFLVREPRGRRDSISFEERCIRNARIDVAWFLTPGGNPVGLPYLATVWDLQHRKNPYFPEVSTTGWCWEDRERNYRSLLPRAARVITGTRAGKNDVVFFYGINPENVHIVPFPAIDIFHDTSPETIDIRRTCGIGNTSFILYPAQFWPHKNHVNLLLALQLLNASSDDPLQLVLTGSDKGNLQHAKETADQLGLSKKVHILGFVPRETLISLYRQALALVFPSFFGPDNLPPLEAFAIGCPVAAANVAGADEQLGDAAILFDPANPAEIAKAIRRIRDNEELRTELISRGRERVAARTPKNYVERICDILDEFEPIRRCWGADYVQHR
jgi:glycosyltransferase involved in cell wall biosynthesis